MDSGYSKPKKKKHLGSYPFAGVIFSITLALFVIGLFGLLLVHTNRLTKSIRENISMQVYLKKSVTESNRMKINRMLTNKPFVAKDGETARIEYISKEKAAERFIRDTGEDFVKFLGDNPLRDAFNIKIKAEYQQADSLKKIKKVLSAVDGVYEVVYTENLVETINRNLTKVSLVLISISVILLAAILVLINNTMKLALFSQRFLIRSMQLVGAKPGFITKPFVWRSAFYGLISGLFASAMLYALLTYADTRIPELKTLRSDKEILIIFGSITIFGIFMSALSTYKAISKYLKMSLDDLY